MNTNLQYHLFSIKKLLFLFKVIMGLGIVPYEVNSIADATKTPNG